MASDHHSSSSRGSVPSDVRDTLNFFNYLVVHSSQRSKPVVRLDAMNSLALAAMISISLAGQAPH